jgi:5-methyltetrahydrofolate--homocysteine methyltransferase
MKVLEELRQAIVKGGQEGQTVTGQALAGVSAQDVFDQAVVPAVSAILDKSEAGEYSLYDSVLAARQIERVLQTVQPDLGDDPVTVVLGTIEDDLDSVDKDLARVLLVGDGFQVFDLDVDVTPQRFVKSALEHVADIVVVFARLPTAMPAMARVIELLEGEGYRDRVKVLLGGAPVTRAFAKEIGADGSARDGVQVVRLAREWAGRDGSS